MYRCTHCNNLETWDEEDSYRACVISSEDPCEACRKLSALNIQISEAKDVLERLLNQRRDIKSSMNQLHGSMIYRMPVEVASTIFEFYVSRPGEPKYPELFSPNIGPSPLTLGAVCQTWRRIAWSTPQLWTIIPMDLSVMSGHVSPGANEKAKTFAQLLSDWIARSGCFPLSIELYANHGVDYSSRTCLSPIIVIINDHATRWKYLDVRLDSSVLPQFFGYSCNLVDVTSELEEIRIWNTTRIPDESQELFSLEGGGDIGGIGRVKPAPKMVDLSAVRLKSLDIEWNNVSRLSVNNLYLAEFFHILRHSPSLVDCKISTFFHLSEDGEVGDIPDPNLPFVHSGIKQLHIHFDDFDCASEFFSRFTLPCLEDLTCKLIQYPIPAVAFISFLVRSGLSSNGVGSSGLGSSHTISNSKNTKLKVLHLIGPTFEGGGTELIQICQIVPALKKFEMLPNMPDRDTSLDVFYRALSNNISATPTSVGGQSTAGSTATPESSTSNEAEEMLLPVLEFFKTQSSYGADFPFDVIPGFFLPFKGSWPNHCRPLQTLDICSMSNLSDPPPSITPETLGLIRELIDRGVDMTIQWATLVGDTDLVHYPLSE